MNARDEPEEIVRTPHRYVVVEGPIRRRQDEPRAPAREELRQRAGAGAGDENPFLERFYRNPRAAAFQTQLYFLFQRARQMQELRQADLFEARARRRHLLDKDRLFARLTLDDEEFALYEQVYARLAIDAPVPDLVVYLQAPVDVLLERIARRGIACEQLIERRYLERLVESYARFFLEYEAAPVLMVNAAEIDPVGSERDYRGCSPRWVRARRGRHYFNPMKSLL